jgi:GDP/UDP-N,N'-diacetylbacillosamine 2-epimerase (hydrolysing)
MRKICVFTATRAEYGLLKPLLTKLKNDSDVELKVIVSGTHLSATFGNTIEEIQEDGFFVDTKIDLKLEDNSVPGMAHSMAIGMVGYTNALLELKPDLAIVLGDRYEALTFALATSLTKTPLAHIHGGELTYGAIDDAYRHSITKIAYWHFVAHEDYRKRVIQLGENPQNVFLVGALGLENIHRKITMSKEEIERKFNFSFLKKKYLLTYHPETQSTKSPLKQIEEVLKAFSDMDDDEFLLITHPNADQGGKEIIREIAKWSQAKKNVKVVPSLGHQAYLSSLKYFDLVIGNSSSGVIEVPSFKIPTVNIGDRQKGRVRANSVFDCSCEHGQIKATIIKALNEKNKFINMKNSLEVPNTSELILTELKKAPIPGSLAKDFYEKLEAN